MTSNSKINVPFDALPFAVWAKGKTDEDDLSVLAERLKDEMGVRSDDIVFYYQVPGHPMPPIGRYMADVGICVIEDTIKDDDILRQHIAGWAATIRPRGYLITVSQNVDSSGAFNDVLGQVVLASVPAGLSYAQHIVWILGDVEESLLVIKESEEGLGVIAVDNDIPHRLVHRDVAIFRKEVVNV